MLPTPSENGRHPTPDELQVELQDALFGALRLASTPTLETAMHMLQAQIASRRAMIVNLTLEPPEVDRLARDVQKRVDRILLIAAELRKRGQAVEWEE